MAVFVIPKTAKARAMLDRMEAGISDAGIMGVLESVAQRTFAALVEATPKRWTGETRRSWRVIKQPGGYRITNLSKVMLFLEEGTKDHGPVNAFTQRPWANDAFNVKHGIEREKQGKSFRAARLYIPLNRAAAIGGWHPGMIYGQDYILVLKVRGITALHIVLKQRERTKVLLAEEMVAYIRMLTK